MRVCVGRPLRNAKVVAFAVGATLSLVAIACTPASGEGPAATTPVSESPTVAAPTSGSPVPEAEVLSERMGLVGNLPGSDGSFAFWGDLAVVNVWADWPELSPDDGFIVDSLGWVYYMRARPLIARGETAEGRALLERSIRELERADELTGGDPVISEHLGDAYFLLDQKKRALELYEEALGMEPRETEQPELRGKTERLRRELGVK